MGGAFSRSKPAGRGPPPRWGVSPGRKTPPRETAGGVTPLAVCDPLDRNGFRPRAHKEASEVIAWAKTNSRPASAASSCPQATRDCVPRAREWSCRTNSSRPSRRKRRPSRGARRRQWTARERRSRPGEERSSPWMGAGFFPSSGAAQRCRGERELALLRVGQGFLGGALEHGCMEAVGVLCSGIVG